MENKTLQKDIYKNIFIWFSMVMICLPTFAALNSVMTKWLDNSGWYKPIQKYIVPWQARMVSKVLMLVSIDSKVTSGESRYAFFMIRDGAGIPVDLSWNCLGWQSILLLIVSLFAGLRGNFTLISRIKIILFGILGTILANVFRMCLVATLIYYVSSFAALVVHDYFAAFITLSWLIIFWTFSYKYILISK